MQRKQLIKKADKLWSEYIKKRDKRCQRCGTTQNLESAHIISRTHTTLRHHPDNGIALCHKCHMYFHAHPLEFEEFIKRKKGGEFLNYLRSLERDKLSTLDLEEIINKLNKLLEEG